MKATTTTTIEQDIAVQKKLTDIFRQAYAHRARAQVEKEAEGKSIGEGLKYAALHKVEKAEVILALTTAGYTGDEAKNYAGQVSIVQRDEQATEKLAKGHITFGKAIAIARQNRKEVDPDNLPPLMHKAYAEAARLAVKADLDKDEHLKRSALAYEEKLAQKRNSVA